MRRELEELLPILQNVARKYAAGLKDPAVDADDIYQEGLLHLLESNLQTSGADFKRQAMRYFVNIAINCYTAGKRGERHQPIDEIVFSLPARGNSFEDVLLRSALDDGLKTLGAFDRKVARQFFEPAREVAEAAIVRIQKSSGHGAPATITMRDIATGLGVPFSRVYAAMRRAREALAINLDMELA